MFINIIKSLSSMSKQIFVNLPVKNLDKTIKFFTKLGFTFNPQFTDKNATCMIVSDTIFVMLLAEKFFKTFIKKEVCDAMKSTEMIMGISVESREKVDEMVDHAIKAGGKEPRKPQDHGWMYGRAFEDPDGHIWEIFSMDKKAMPQEMKKRK